MLQSKFIGIPFVEKTGDFNNADCFGLVVLFYKEIMKIDIFGKLEHYHYKDIKKILMQYLSEVNTNWKSVKIDNMQFGDVIAMAHDLNHPNVIQHFGIYLEDGKMLHTLQDVGSHIVDIKKYEYYIKGVHRWQKL